MESLTENQRHMQRYEQLETEFAPWKALYRDITDYILPQRGYDLQRDGEPTSKAVWNSNIINDAATRANRVLGAGMQGGLSAKSRKWFKLSLMDSDFANWGPIKTWLKGLEDATYKLLAGSNYYTTNHDLYEEQGGFGPGCMFFERDPNTHVRFKLSTAGECRFALGPDGRVDTVYRKIPRTAKQIVERFGINNVSDAVGRAYKDRPYTFHNIIHVIEPNGDYNPQYLDGLSMPWRSYWFEEREVDRPLLVWGFPYFPGIVTAWSKIRNCPYGLGPGHDVLGHAKMLQEMEKSVIKGVHRMTDPPMAFPSPLKDMINLLPGAANFVDIMTKDRMVGPMYQVNFNIEQAEYKIDKIESKIEKTYYNDLFLLIAATMNESPQKTATEILAREEEKMLLLGPTVERQIDDNLAPTIKWVADVAVEDGLVPEPPEGVTREQLDIQFVGPLAQAQQQIDARSMESNLAIYERLINLGDESAMTVHATVNWLEYIQKHEEITSMPSGILRSRDEAEQRLAQMVMARQQMAQMEQAAGQIEMAKSLGQASTEKGTALGDIKDAIEAR